MPTKDQINKTTKEIASSIKGDDGDSIENDIIFFQSGDVLELPITDALGGISGGDGPSVTLSPKGKGEDEGGNGKGQGEGPEGEGPEGPEGGHGGGEEKGPEIPPERETKIKVGDKVRDKNTGGVGIVTEINDDGTYHVEPIESYAKGGEIENDLSCVGVSKFFKNDKPIFLLNVIEKEKTISCDILCYGKNGWEKIKNVEYLKTEFNKNFENKDINLKKLYFIQKEKNGLCFTDNLEIAKKYQESNHIDFFDINCFTICSNDEFEDLGTYEGNFLIKDYNDGFDTFDNYIVFN